MTISINKRQFLKIGGAAVASLSLSPASAAGSTSKPISSGSSALKNITGDDYPSVQTNVKPESLKHNA
jgi:hypothetical protein